MINLIFTKTKAEGKEVWVDSRPFFRDNKEESWFQDKLVQVFMRLIDGAEVIDGFVLRDRLGTVIPPEYLSTGCKTAILIYLFPDKIFNVTQCGDNAFSCVTRMCRRFDRTVLTYRYLPKYALSDAGDARKDGQPIDLDTYDDDIDVWLEEIYAD